MNHFFDPRDFGARADGAHDDTAAIQGAIDEAASRGGGRVLLSGGTFLSGAIKLRSRICFEIDAGAILQASPSHESFGIVSARWEGKEMKSHAPFIGGNDLDDVQICGQGVVDGAGASWWSDFRNKKLQYPRPRLVSISDSRNLSISGLRFQNSPSWTINPVRCSNVHVQGISIINPPDSPNTDGINPDSCSGVRVIACRIDVGDDCITLKSGIESEDPELRKPCHGIVIADCILKSGHGGVVMGSEMSGGVSDVLVSNCYFEGTDRGIRLKTRRGRGGAIEFVRVSNVIMRDVLCPFTVNMYYGCGAWGDPVVADKGARPVDQHTPRIEHLSIQGLTSIGTRLAAGFVYGLPESPVSSVYLADWDVSMTQAAQKPEAPEMGDGILDYARAGFLSANAQISFDKVRIRGQTGPELAEI